MLDYSITAYTVTTALGAGNDDNRNALLQGRSALQAFCDEPSGVRTWTGRVNACDTQALDEQWAAYDCRNNRLAALALAQDDFATRARTAIAHYGAQRVGVFMGTSTSGIQVTEQAYHERARAGRDGAIPAGQYSHEHTHQLYAVARYVRQRLNAQGPAQVISTACSSGAKVFASAARCIEAGFIDAAIVGGVDSLCDTTLFGFNALQLISPRPCRPWDAARDGINIGEGAGFALLEREPHAGAPRLIGCGESSDAHHMSAPHPNGTHTAHAMRTALQQAGVTATDIDYVNLHATATLNNDRAEDRALQQVFGCDSTTGFAATKGYTGHTLGAAGMVESVFCLMSLEQGFIPASAGLNEPDPNLQTRVSQQVERREVRLAMNNSFGFGGSNTCLVFGVDA